MYYGQDFSTSSERNSIHITPQLRNVGDAAREVPLDLEENEIAAGIEAIRPRNSNTRLDSVVNIVYIVRRTRFS